MGGLALAGYLALRRTMVRLPAVADFGSSAKTTVTTSEHEL